MLVETRDFGQQTFEEAECIIIPKGLFAFEEKTRYVLVKPLPDDTSPMWLQSVEDSALCFIVFSPTALFDKYRPVLEDDEKKELNISSADDIVMLSIALIPEDYAQTTVNLKCPIVLNVSTMTAKQVILTDDYPLKAEIFTKGDENKC